MYSIVKSTNFFRRGSMRKKRTERRTWKNGVEEIIFYGYDDGEEVEDHEYRAIGTRQYLLPEEAEKVKEKVKEKERAL